MALHCQAAMAALLLSLVAVQCYGTASVTLTAEYGHRGTPRYAEAAHLAAYPKYSHGAQVQPGAHHTEHPRKFLPAPQRHAGRRSHVDAEASHLLPRQHAGEAVVPEEEPTPEDPFAEPRVPLSEWRWDDNLAAAEECATRTNAPVKAFPGITHRLSVVISLCKEDLSSLADLPCRGTWYYFYTRCRLPSNYIAAALPKLAKCMTVSKAEGASYTQTYLKYIIDRYHSMPAQTMFTSPTHMEKLGLQMKDLIAMAQGAGSNWAYKAFAEPKRRLSMQTFSELCPAVQRYTCMRACSADTLENAAKWYRFNTYSVFLASQDRIRSLLRDEYKWLSLYATRAARTGEEQRRPELRNVLEPLWGMLLGCPQDSGSATPTACSASQRFGVGSSRQPMLATAPWIPDSRKVLEQEVVARQTQGGAPTLPPGSPRIGVALVFCEEPISFIDEVGCNGVVYHLYSKCGVTRARAEAMAPKSAACFASFSEVPVTLETELAWPKHHAQYLQHIITRYDRLEPYTIFVKANLEKRRLSLGEMVNIIDDKQWGFISFGNPKIKVNMTSFPETGHVGVWQREICALYRRYTGADPCQMDEAYMKEIGFKPYFYNTRSMWAASAPRLRSLPVTEYQWFREYIMSITFEKRVKRRYVPERIWQAMLGCPSELKTRDIIGCSPTEWHPSGLAVEPPGVMLADGLVTWPQIPVQEFDPDLPYPSFFRKHNTPRVTFVGSYVGGYDEDARTVMVSVLVAAAKLHPDCTFVMLTDMTTPREMFSPDMWLGRLEVRRYDLDYQQRAQDLQYTPTMSSAADFFQAHGVEAGSAPDWQGDVKLQKLIAAFTWARLHLEACFLRDAMVAVQTGYFGHLALMDFSAFFTNSIADIFEPPGSSGVSGWQAGIVYRPVKGAVAATSVWYVPQNHAAEAFALVTVALQMARPVDTGPAFKGEGYLDVHSQAMTAALHCCLSSTDDEQWWRSGGQQSALCDLGACGLKRGNAPPSITLNLMPCASNLAHVGGSFVRQCAMPNSPADALATKAVKWGQREFLSEVYGLFKVKDKSTGYLSTKSAIRDFITVYGDAEPALAQRYTDLVQALVDP